MGLRALHQWTTDLEEAIRIQQSLAGKLVLSWDERPIKTVAGIDFAYASASVFAAIAVLSYPILGPLEVVAAQSPTAFPYLPGLLAFRLVPPILAASEKLSAKPDMLLVHGHGIAHPRHIGLASHLGLWLNQPTIGVAQARLFGLQGEMGSNKGDWSPLRDEANPAMVIGATLRTRSGTRPVFVSPGHLIDLEKSLEIVLVCCRDYHLPEPIRVAHQAAVKVLHENVGA